MVERSYLCSPGLTLSLEEGEAEIVKDQQQSSSASLESKSKLGTECYCVIGVLVKYGFIVLTHP